MDRFIPPTKRLSWKSADAFARQGFPNSGAGDDPAATGRLEFFLAELKKRGICANLNLNASRQHKPGDGVRDSSLSGYGHGDWQLNIRPYVSNALPADVEAARKAEAAYFSEQLRVTDGNLDETARRAGINPRSLYDLMKRHGMDKRQFRGRGK